MATDDMVYIDAIGYDNEYILDFSATRTVSV